MERFARFSLPAACLAAVLAASAVRAGEGTRLLESALAAAGAHDAAEIERWRGHFEDVCRAARPRALAIDSPVPRAEFLLEVLHEKVLRGSYEPHVWSVAETLETGRYNCLTAAILYLELCREFEAPVTPRFAPGHLLCRIEAEPPQVVETTCRRWFGQAEEFRRAHAARLGELRLLSDAELIAKVHYNRALEQVRGGRTELAACSFAESCRLDPHDSAARENLALAQYELAGACEQGPTARLDPSRTRTRPSLSNANARPEIRRGLAPRPEVSE